MRGGRSRGVAAGRVGRGAGALGGRGELTNGGGGASRGAGSTAVKRKLNDACTERKGTPKADSFEVVFEKTSENPNVPKPYYVDGKMQCELPG